MSNNTHPPTLAAEALAGSTVLCASARLAHGLRQSLIARFAGPETAWQPPQIHPLQDWLLQLTEQAILSGQIAVEDAPAGMLSQTQEALLWEQAIQHCMRQFPQLALLNTQGLASAAMEANRYLIEWDISLDMTAASEETRQFMRWRQQFQSLCRESGQLEAVRYQAWQLSLLQQGRLSLPPQVVLAGFDRIQPHLQRLIHQMQARGTAVYRLANETVAHTLSRQAYADNHAEMRAAVHWAQQWLQRVPSAKLAIVVPELDTQRETLAQLLDDTFHPQSLHPAHSEMPRCYEFSLGLPLHRWPVVHSALTLLQLATHTGPIAQPNLSRLLGDVYWSQALTEADARAALDAEMRRMLSLQIQLNSLLKLVVRQQQEDAPIISPALLADLSVLVTLPRQWPSKQAPSAWAERFASLLEATHWPGERSLSSHEYQCQQAWQQVLTTLASLDPWCGHISAASAVQRLRQLCQAHIFQPQTVVSPSITVMGLLEASAQPLDGLWVMGMNDHLWPPLARTNALIPADVQRSAETPNASSAVQLTFARAIDARLRSAAGEVIFSYARMEGDRQLRMSPLIAELPESAALPGVATLAETLANQGPLSQPQSAQPAAAAQATAWQWLDDHQAPQVAEGEHISGGTGLLKAQTICPAWAFYQYRLKAYALKQPHNGLDAMQRGDLLHHLLAAFWRQVDRDTWAQLTPNDLQATLASLAAITMTQFNQQFAQPFSPVFCQLEAERLTKLALTWLIEVERQREQPFSVSLIEQSFTPLIEGIQIKLIIDRVDTLADGRRVVIDYKTGSVPDFKNWATTQLTEPQLPLYAAFVLQDAEIAAVCFAHVRLTDAGFVGIAADAEVLPGVKAFNQGTNPVFNPAEFADWADIRRHWQQQLTRTALTLKAGDAAVVFDDETALTYCDVLPLLRLPERQLQFEYLQAEAAR